MAASFTTQFGKSVFPVHTISFRVDQICRNIQHHKATASSSEDEDEKSMEKVFHMVGGEGKTSYAKNSSGQRLILKKVKLVLQKCIEELLRDMGDLPDCVKVADLGCSSGPNTFLTMEHIIESIDKASSQMIRNDEEPRRPAIQYFLSDLVSNDFNLVFRGLPGFYEKLEKEYARPYQSCLVAATPGSFYGRLFPDRSMHFVHSSYSLHWLSQVPSGLVSKLDTPRNKGSIYWAKTSHPNVHQAYLDQFAKDFAIFLGMRSQEMAQHARLLLTFICKDEEQVEGSHFLFIMGMALTDMVAEGLIEEEKLDSFNMPIYTPSVQETKQIIESEGSFKILRIQTFKSRLDAAFNEEEEDEEDDDDSVTRAMYVATYLRAVYEPVLASHFGEAVMNSLFHRFADMLVKVVRMRQGPYNNIVISLLKQ